MKETWRWFGPLDQINISEIAQTGAQGIVSALHEIPYGEIWSRDAIAGHKARIAAAPGHLTWDVVESLPLHEDIKRGAGNLNPLFANYRQSMANLAAEGIKTICYNFMPLLDWTRTHINAPLPNGGSALRYDATAMAAFDIFMLERENAEDDHLPAVCEGAKTWFDQASDTDKSDLLTAIMSGLPGAYARYDITGLQEALAPWQSVDVHDLRHAYTRFLAEIMPAADDLGMRLCVHPDDPPRSLLGLPRIVSNRDDIAFILNDFDSPNNGLTLCTGSLGANPANDPVAIAREFADRIHFAHLRNVKKEPDGSFQEAAHLAGDTDMAAVIEVLLQEEERRQNIGRTDSQIPFRPDHGHALLSDVNAGTHPGYPMIGRLRGLAELRGVIAGLNHGRKHHG